MKRDLGDGFEVDDDSGRVDLREVHRFLSEEAYWALAHELYRKLGFAEPSYKMMERPSRS